jgi:ribonuclease PH
MFMRDDGRQAQELRPVRLTRHYTKNAPGSVLCEFGDTKVFCTAMLEPGVPPFLEGKNQGWLSAEYSMLPGSTLSRKMRSKTGPDGRSHEIQRLIGRSLRTILNLKALGEQTLWVDCDVLQADGGTRTCAITGAYLAVADAISAFHQKQAFETYPLTGQVAAISVGILHNEVLLDLAMKEDTQASVDMNIVMTTAMQFIEVQGTGEKQTFTEEQLFQMLSFAKKGISTLFELQKQALLPP